MDRIEQLKEKIIKLYHEPGYYETSIQGLKVSKREEPTELKKCFYTPLVILILQGSKQTIFGDREFTFGAGQYMVCSVDIPLMSRIKTATKEKPCIGLVIELNSYLISQLMTEMNMPEVEYNEKSSHL